MEFETAAGKLKVKTGVRVQSAPWDAVVDALVMPEPKKSNEEILKERKITKNPLRCSANDKHR